MNNKPSKVWPKGIKPSIGDIATAKEVGRMGRALHVWEACPSCGTERWIKLNTTGVLCKSCALRLHSFGEQNRRWAGGRKVARNGIFIFVTPDHPFYAMSHKDGSYRSIAEHRLVMAQHLGRCLKPWEVVHHINRNNLDNHLENLLLLPNQTVHQSYTLLQNRVSQLESRITLLEAENELLKAQVKVVGYGNPELAEGNKPSGKCRDFIPPIPLRDEEKVHPLRKLRE